MAPSALENRVTITVTETAELLGIGRTSAYEAIRRGELPSLRIGRRLVVPVAQLLAALGVQSNNGENQ